jgi:NTP pyrophosphatase (non-canonical NTP hydrolase)
MDEKQINEEQLYEKALNTFGESIQTVVAMEELAELQQALSKHLRCKDHNVEEEIADVEIMIGQLKLLFDKDKVEKIKQEKLHRLKGLVW